MSKHNNVSNIKCVFFGTSHFAEVALDTLKESGFTPTLVITAPDKPKGRKLILTPPPVKLWADAHSIDVVQPEKIDADFILELANTDWDLFIVASYGKILPKKLLDVPRHGTLNIHPSLLPKLRGPSPIQSAVLTEKETGVTIMLIDEQVDHGPIVAQARVVLEEWPMRTSHLTEILATEGARLLYEVIPQWIQGTIEAEEQDHNSATITHKIVKEDGRLDLAADPYENYRKFLAYDAGPGTYFLITRKGKSVRVKITEASFADNTFSIEKIIPEGKKEMRYEDFMRN